MKSPASLRSDRVATFPGLGGRFHRNTQPFLTAAQTDQEEIVIPGKTVLFVTLQTGVSTDTARPGDRFHARLAVPITWDDQIVIPVGSYLIGQVDHVSKPGRLKGKGEIVLSFDTIIFPSGVTRRLEARAEQAEGYLSGSGAKEGKITTTSKQADDVLKYGTGVGAAGAGIGAVADHSLKGAGIGGAIGAAGGAVVGLLLRGQQVAMARGTSLTVQLQQDTVLKRPIRRQRRKLVP